MLHSTLVGTVSEVLGSYGSGCGPARLGRFDTFRSCWLMDLGWLLVEGAKDDENCIDYDVLKSLYTLQ